MTPKSRQKSKIGCYFCKMRTYDPVSPSSAIPVYALRISGKTVIRESYMLKNSDQRYLIDKNIDCFKHFMWFYFWCKTWVIDE